MACTIPFEISSCAQEEDGSSSLYGKMFVMGACVLLLVLVLARWWFVICCKEHTCFERTDAAADGGKTMRDDTSIPRHKVFLSHSGARREQKDFVEQLFEDLERCERHPFFDKSWDSLVIGKRFPGRIFDVIEQCEVGVVVLSEEFFSGSKWPMLELVAMVKNPKLVIIPVFFRISPKGIGDRKNHSRWRRKWCEWAREGKKNRINVEEWFEALKSLRSINGLVDDGQGDVSFRKRIFAAVCKHVRPQTRWQVCHVQGRSRLCKVIQDKMEHMEVSQHYGVCLVGLYGMGGIGKSTICESMCDEYFTRMRGRVFHAELGSGSELEVIQKALKSLTSKSHEVLGGLNLSQSRELLSKEMGNQEVFLAIDNVSDSDNSVDEAKSFLCARFARGSVVLVTSRSFDILSLGRLNIDRYNCMEMPELEEDEAKAIFLHHAKRENGSCDIDEEVVGLCVKRCHFRKSDGSYHHHPLALKVLGSQLGSKRYDMLEWKAQLEEPDPFNQSRSIKHPIFSILRRSYDTMGHMDQLLFIDVALYRPGRGYFLKYYTVLEWLSMMHGTSVRKVMDRLEGMKRKSLVEGFGDGYPGGIGMHDLWREFSETETRIGEFECRRWVYEVGEDSALEEAYPSGGCWHNVKRMCFLEGGLRRLHTVNLDHFSNVTAMKLGVGRSETSWRLDVTNLKNLKSLEMISAGPYSDFEVFGFGLLRNLRFLRLISGVMVDEFVTFECIGELTNLEVLVLGNSRNSRLPDLSKLISLRVVEFSGIHVVGPISGLSSRLAQLRYLNLRECRDLRSLGDGVGDLFALEELCLQNCKSLDELPNVRQLTRLKILDVSGTRVNALPGLGELIALEKLVADGCEQLAELPDLEKLRNLEVLDLNLCPLVFAPGMGSLVGLKKLKGCFGLLKDSPDLRSLTSLRDVDLEGWSPMMLWTLVDLAWLEWLTVKECRFSGEPFGFAGPKVVRNFPFNNFRNVLSSSSSTCHEYLQGGWRSRLERVVDMCHLERLKVLKLQRCMSLLELSCTIPLTTLQSLSIANCWDLKALPDLSIFPVMMCLELYECKSLMQLACCEPLSTLVSLYLSGCSCLEAVPDLSKFPKMKTFQLRDCNNLMELACCEPLTSLKSILLWGCRCLKSIPDMSKFPEMMTFELTDCESLLELACCEPLITLRLLQLWGCNSLKSIPDMSKFPEMWMFILRDCVSLMELACCEPLITLKSLQLWGNRCLKSIPDLSKFPKMKTFEVRDCNNLMELACCEPLTSLKSFLLWGCRCLKSIPDMSKFPEMMTFQLIYCESLMELACCEPLTSLESILLWRCRCLKSIPDMSKFPGMMTFELIDCESLLELACCEPLITLKSLQLWGCNSLKSIPDMSKFPEMWIFILSD